MRQRRCTWWVCGTRSEFATAQPSGAQEITHLQANLTVLVCNDGEVRRETHGAMEPRNIRINLCAEPNKDQQQTCLPWQR